MFHDMDNAINHAATLQPVRDRAAVDERVDALVVPVGKGVLLCRKIGENVRFLRGDV